MPPRPDANEPRRWRLDEQGQADPGPPRRSGRLVVVVLVSGLLAIWLGLDLAFKAWKARYEALARFGASEVAPRVDPLAALMPPDVAPAEWRGAVAETHAMLLALTGSGVLDRPEMEALGADLAERVARARPETARQTLADLWDAIEHQAGPVIAPDRTPPPANSRHAARHPRPPRPRLLGPSLAERRAVGSLPKSGLSSLPERGVGPPETPPGATSAAPPPR